MTDTVRSRIDELVQKNEILLFMKGTVDFPQCGFSSRAISLLDHYQVEFVTFNVLLDEEVREGIKQYSDWPTIPQLYVRGEFLGGSDILMEMHQDGTLKEALGKTN